MLSNVGRRATNTELNYTKPLFPLFEAISNSFHAIEDKQEISGEITVSLFRDLSQAILSDDTRFQYPINGFSIRDNGIGFNELNYTSFNTADSDYKVGRGGKGVGRFLWLKSFNKVEVESVFFDNKMHFKRTFGFIPDKDGIENHKLVNCDASDSYSIVSLSDFVSVYQKHCPKDIDTICHYILEHFLEYFRKANCPNLLVVDSENKVSINKLFEAEAIKSKTSEFILKNERFILQHIQLVSPHISNHKIHYTADDRTVISEIIKKSINNITPKIHDEETGIDFSYSCYVESEYLNRNTNSERTRFNIIESDALDSIISWSEIQENVYNQISEYLQPYLNEVKQRKEEKIKDFINSKAPMYKPVQKYISKELDTIDPAIVDNDHKLEIEMFKIMHTWQEGIKAAGKDILQDFPYKSEKERDDHNKKVDEYFQIITDANKHELAKYICDRKQIIDFFETLLDRQKNGKYNAENQIHNLLFPMGNTSESVLFDDHNLWLIDERLVFHSFLASDKSFSSHGPLISTSTKEPDIIVYDKALMLKTEKGDSSSDGITIIEIKKPMRSAYTNDDPFEQLKDYVDIIRDGKAISNKGRPLPSYKNAPISCYLICDLTDQIRKRALRNDLTESIDSEGYFGYWSNQKAYIEVISFNKLLANAKRRNMAFFDKLGLSVV